jgi:hypothetical protein
MGSSRESSDLHPGVLEYWEGYQVLSFRWCLGSTTTTSQSSDKAEWQTVESRTQSNRSFWRREDWNTLAALATENVASAWWLRHGCRVAANRRWMRWFVDEWVAAPLSEATGRQVVVFGCLKRLERASAAEEFLDFASPDCCCCSKWIENLSGGWFASRRVTLAAEYLLASVVSISRPGREDQRGMKYVIQT